MQTREIRSVREPGLRWVVLLLAALVALGTWLRVHGTLTDPGFASSPPAGLLRSDPALLAYFTQRIEESGGLPPDFREDPRIEHPLRTDVPALFPVGPEFAVAALHRILGPDVPLERAGLYASSFAASTLVIGAYLLGRALGRGRWPGLAAALLAALLPANYRTLGFLFVGEDYSLPLFSLHLGLAALAAVRPGRALVFASALCLLLSLSCWHAASFFLALEAAAFVAWFWISGRNLFAGRAALAALVLLSLGSLAVPVLRHTLFVVSLPMQLLGGLAIAGLAARRTSSPGAQRLALLAGVLALFGLSLLVARLCGGGIGEYSHVFGLLWHKLVNFGALPDDPAALPFEVRLMWQGPFATLAPGTLAGLLGVGGAGCAWAGFELAGRARRAQLDDARAVACLLACLALPLSWLIERTLVLPAMLAGPLLVALVTTLPERARAAGLVGALAVQAALLASYLHAYRIPWYQPPVRQQELAAVVDAVQRLVPEGEAVATDFVNGPALLVRTRHPILLQPKWEVRRSRERIERFLTAFFHAPPDELRRLLREEFRCRFLLIDRAQLVLGCRYAAGIGSGRELDAASAASRLGGQESGNLAPIPGYRLLYRSPPNLRQSNGQASDLYRLYELLPDPR